MAKAPEQPQPAITAPAAPAQQQTTETDEAAPEGDRTDKPALVAKAPEQPQPAITAPAAPAQRQTTETDEAAPEDDRADKPALVAKAPEQPQPAVTAPAAPAHQQTTEPDEAAPEDDRADKPALVAKAPEQPQPAVTAPAAPAQQQAAAGMPNAPPSAGGVSVDSVDYDDRGNLALAGKAEPGSVVEPKIALPDKDAESLGEARADKKGEWRLRVERPIAPGRYDLTVEERSAEGAPRSRLRLPFERADPITDFPPGDIVVVQPGNSLWRIARRVYGQGVRYTTIYAANQAQIGNPNLIFPGQIFSVPQQVN